MATQAELKAQRRAKQERDLAKRKKQAETAVKKTTGLLAGSLSKIRQAEKRRKAILDSI